MWLFIFVLLVKGYFPEPVYKRYILFSLQRFNLGKSSSQNMAHTCTLRHIIWLCSNDATKIIICPILDKSSSFSFFFEILNETILYQSVMMKTNYIFEALGVHRYLTVTTNNSYITVV